MNIENLLTLKDQPISNRFFEVKQESEELYSLELLQCQNCGVIQMKNSVPASKLIPVYDWITYSEPEEHLDDLVRMVCALPGITHSSKFCGISYKDDSTLARLEKQGFPDVTRLDLRQDLGISLKGAGVETIQEKLTLNKSTEIVQKLGAFDVVIARHILEHAHDVMTFVQALRKLVKPDGYLVLEVPDCSRSLESYDYTMIWEEHTVYFTPATFENSLFLLGFELYRYKCYPYPYENSLVGIARAASVKTPQISQEILREQLEQGMRFAQYFPKKKAAMRKFLKLHRSDGKTAIFGAGHLACTFVCGFGLQQDIDFFIDDNPRKLGLFMPGSQLPIMNSSSLHSENVKLCLLSVNLRLEDRVFSAHRDCGATFYSIFPNSRIAIRFPDLIQDAAHAI